MGQQWPESPSRKFRRWAREFEIHREKWAPDGTRIKVGRPKMEHLYLVFDGPDEVWDLEALSEVSATLERLKAANDVLDRLDAEAVVEAAREGGFDWAIPYVKVEEDWIRKQANMIKRKGRVKEYGEAEMWVEITLGDGIENALIRAAELYCMRDNFGGARNIASNLIDASMWELYSEGGCRKSELARALGWSNQRVSKRLFWLEEHEITKAVAARRGQVRGVTPLRKPATAV